MYLTDANFCIDKASEYNQPDMQLCSLIERIAWTFVQRKSIDFDNLGARGLRISGITHGSRLAPDGSRLVSKPLDRLEFIDDGRTEAMAFVDEHRVEIYDFSHFLEDVVLTLAPIMAAKELRAT